ncbi:hypothetical protein [Daejeonella oryzae]|uniref:hypothetical protein n=1 Tax=Daejeonella oryzae TaxID=1122943 RepID=UPI000424439A|nr:hypothetical protein [Daejeonella oryzae]
MRYFIVFLCAASLFSCSQNKQTTKKTGSYFEVKEFFEKEVKRLQKSNPVVTKIVSRNNVSQTKDIRDINWENELSLFIESDINKPAWNDSYKIRVDGLNTLYTATDTSLRTRELRIRKDKDGFIKQVEIQNKTINRLYQSTEKLIYFPDSLYQIHKTQNVLIIGNNRYFIQGNLK